MTTLTASITVPGAHEASLALAASIANGFDNPPDFMPWWLEPAACHHFVNEQLKKGA